MQPRIDAAVKEGEEMKFAEVNERATNRAEINTRSLRRRFLRTSFVCFAWLASRVRDINYFSCEVRLAACVGRF